MAASGFTPIQLFRTTTASATPTALSLADGELAINLTDEKLYFKNAAGVVKLLASNSGSAGSVTSVDVSGGTTGLTTSGGPITSSGTITLAGTLGAANGGTGATTLSANGVLVGNGTSAVTAVVGTTGRVLTGNTGSAPTFEPITNLAVSSLSFGTTGLTPAGATTGAITVAGTLAVANGGTGVTTSTGTGSVVLNTSPTLVTPVLGAASATSIANGLGAVATPSYTFTGDTNTGMWSPSSDTLAFSTAGSERVRVDASGRFFIGTTTGVGSELTSIRFNSAGSFPQGLNMVDSNASANGSIFQVFRRSDDTFLGSIRRSGTDNAITVGGNSYLALATGDTERARIDSSGNVGIGATSGGYKLDVTAGGPTAVFGSASGSGLSAYTAWRRDGTILGYVGNGTGVLAGSGATDFAMGSTGTRNLCFGTNDTERARIDSSGNVGIGTTTPQARLEAFGGNIRTSLVGGASTTFRGYEFASETTEFGSLKAQASSGEMRLTAGFSGFGGFTTFHTNGAERMAIDASGNVGIGTASPTQKFEVSDSGTYVARFNRTGVAAIRVSVGGNGIYGIDTESADLQLATNGTEKARITAAGGLAVGTTTDPGAGNIGLAAGGKLQFSSSAYITPENNVSGAEISTPGAITFRTGSGTTERARIDSSGNLLVGTTSTSTTSASGVKVLPAANGANGPQVAVVTSASGSNTSSLSIYSTGASAFRFYVDDAGTIFATSATISAISDIRLKENVRDLDAGLDTILALKPRRFDWKEGKGKDIRDDMGFIAQEVEDVLPALIGGWKAGEGEPDDMKSVKAGDLIPVLVKAIQELTARVAQLEGN
jgi:hypothetical protein